MLVVEAMGADMFSAGLKLPSLIAPSRIPAALVQIISANGRLNGLVLTACKAARANRAAASTGLKLNFHGASARAPACPPRRERHENSSSRLGLGQIGGEARRAVVAGTPVVRCALPQAF